MIDTLINNESKVWLVSHTQIHDNLLDSMDEIDHYSPGFKEWLSEAMKKDVSHGETLIEMMGRGCYRSWRNPSGRDNEAYIGNIINADHFSVLEHASAGFFIYTDRSVSHELVRHRHQSFSQESTRYVPYHKGVEPSYIVPEMFMETEEDRATVEDFLEATKKMYEWAYDKAEERFDKIQDRTMKRKLIRQSARIFMPHSLSTTIGITGNYRTWLEAIPKRTSYHADVGIREVYIKILRHLIELAPSVFDRFEFKIWEDGTEYAELV